MRLPLGTRAQVVNGFDNGDAGGPVLGGVMCFEVDGKAAGGQSLQLIQAVDDMCFPQWALAVQWSRFGA